MRHRRLAGERNSDVLHRPAIHVPFAELCRLVQRLPARCGFRQGSDGRTCRRTDAGQWFDITASTNPAPGTGGNIGPQTGVGPGIANLDFSLFKTSSSPSGIGCSSAASG